MERNDINKLKNILFKDSIEVFFPKKTIIINEGETAHNFFFLKKGLLRGWTNNDGKEVTFQFIFDGNIFCAAQSFFNNEASLYTIETVEDSLILSIHKDDFCKYYQNEEAKNLLNQFLITRLTNYQQLLISRIQDKPEIRYKKLLEKNPEYVLRIPQKIIASYLGITPVSLSRIRNRK